MLRLIAALDVKRGIAVDGGVPWTLPGDVAYFHRRTAVGVVVMGRSTYEEFAAPLHDGVSFVLTRAGGELRSGFEPVSSLDEVRARRPGDDVWVVGGAAVFSASLGQADELALTQVDGDFACTKFFPVYAETFTLAERDEEQCEGGVRYWFETWRPTVALPTPSD